jgi:hypothetical protein
MGLWYTIISKISKVPTDPMSAKNFIQGQRSKISFFCIFLVNGKCYHKNCLDKVVDHAIFYKIGPIFFFLRITIPEISPFQKLKSHSTCIPGNEGFLSELILEELNFLRLIEYHKRYIFH